MVAEEVARQGGAGGSVDLSGYLRTASLSSLTTRPVMDGSVRQVSIDAATNDLVTAREVSVYVSAAEQRVSQIAQSASDTASSASAAAQRAESSVGSLAARVQTLESSSAAVTSSAQTAQQAAQRAEQQAQNVSGTIEAIERRVQTLEQRPAGGGGATVEDVIGRLPNASSAANGLMTSQQASQLATLVSRPEVTLPGLATANSNGLMSATHVQRIDALERRAEPVVTPVTTEREGLATPQMLQRITNLESRSGGSENTFRPSQGFDMANGRITGLPEAQAGAEPIIKSTFDSAIQRLESLIDAQEDIAAGPERFGVHVQYYGPSQLGSPSFAGNSGSPETNQELIKVSPNANGRVTWKGDHTVSVSESGLYFVEIQLIGGNYNDIPLWVNHLVSNLPFRDSPNNSAAHAVYGGRLSMYCTMTANTDYRLCITSSDSGQGTERLSRRNVNGVKITLRKVQ